MPTEDQHFINGPGRFFRPAYLKARRGENYVTLAKAVINDLRKDIREIGGPSGLSDLARSTGVLSSDERLWLPLPVHREELDRLLNLHRDLNNPLSLCNVHIIQREWNRLHRTDEGLRTLDELTTDWCTERVKTLFFSRIEGRLENLSTEENLELIRLTEREVRRRLRDEDLDIIHSLRRDPTGAKVRRRTPAKKENTVELLDIPIPVLGDRSR